MSKNVGPKCTTEAPENMRLDNAQPNNAGMEMQDGKM